MGKYFCEPNTQHCNERTIVISNEINNFATNIIDWLSTRQWNDYVKCKPLCNILRGFLCIYNHLHWSHSFKSFINSLINRMDLGKSMENRSVNSMHCGIGMLKNDMLISTSEINLEKNNDFMKTESPVHISSPYTHVNFTEIIFNEPSPLYDAYDQLKKHYWSDNISTNASSFPTEENQCCDIRNYKKNF